MFWFRALLVLSACVVYGQKKGKTNVFTIRPVSTIYLPHNYVGGEKKWGINKNAAVKTAYDMDTKLAYSAGKKWIHVVDFAELNFPKILDKFESPRPLTDIAECGQYVAWAIEGAEITDSGTVVLYDKFDRVAREWNMRCEFTVGSRPKSIKFTKDCSTIVVANEGVADTAGQGAASQWVNPEGSVSIIRLYGRQHESQGPRGGGGGGRNWGNQGGTHNNWGNAGGGGQWGNNGPNNRPNWNNGGQNGGGNGWNNGGPNQGPGGPNGGGRGWNNQGPNQGGWNGNQGPNNRGQGWNNQGPNQGGGGQWGNNGGPPNNGPNNRQPNWNNQGPNAGGPNRGPNGGGQGWNTQGPPRGQGPNNGQGWNNQGPNQGGWGQGQGPNPRQGWNNQGSNQGGRGQNQGPGRGQGWNTQGPNQGGRGPNQGPGRGQGWNNQGPNQGGRGQGQGPNPRQGWNNQGPNQGGRGQSQGPNPRPGWNNRGPNQGPNPRQGWNNQGPNQGGRGPNQGPNQGPNPRQGPGGPNRGSGSGWNNQGGPRGNPQNPNQGRPNAGGTGWNRGQTNGPNAGRGPNNGNPSWQRGQGPAPNNPGNFPPNNRPNGPGQRPMMIRHELGQLIRQKRQYPPPPQTPQWQPQTPRWQPPQRPNFPQSPAQGPGFNPGRGQGGQRPGSFPLNPQGGNPQGQNPQGGLPQEGGVQVTRGTCQGQGNFRPTITTMDFTKFNQRADAYKAELVRHPYTGQMGDNQPNTFSQGLEPEYVTFDPMETMAYVSLQENNAIASVDLFTNEVTGIHPLGAKQWKRYDLDPSPGNGRGFQKYDIESFRQPDAIESYTAANGETYILTANEGKQLEYYCNLNACPPGGGEFVEFEKGDEFPEDYWLTDKLLQRVSNEEMLDAFRLGNLEFSRIDGRSVEQPLKHDNVYFYGGRGISAYRVDRRTGNLTLAWDSGDIIEKATAKYLPKMHNGNNRVGDPSITMASTFDSRSDQMGPECESLAVGEVQGTKLIFVGIDRISAIAIFSVPPDGNLPIFESIFRDGHIDESFTQLYNTKRFGDSDPESLTFIPPEKSADRRPYLMVTGRVSGTISFYQIRDEPIWMLLKNNPSSGDVRQLASLPVVVLSTVLGIIIGFRRWN